MNDVFELRQQRAKLIERAGAILKSAENRGEAMDEADTERFKKLHTEADGILARVDGIDRQQVAGASISNFPEISLSGLFGGGSRRAVPTVPGNAMIPSATSMVDHVRANEPDAEEYADLDPGAFIRSMVCGPQNELERRALAEGSDSSGGYTVPSITSARLIDGLRAASVVLKAGAQMVPLETDSTTIARVLTDPTVEWLAENAVQSDSSPTFGAVIMVPKTLRALVRASRELIDDSVNINEALQKMFVGSMSQELDRAALVGSGSGAEPEGIKNITGIGSVEYDANGLPMLDSTIYPAILDTIYEVDVDNAGPVNAMIMHPRTARDLNKLVETASASYQPLQTPPVLANLPILQTTAMPIDETDPGTTTAGTTILVGRWDNLFIGMRLKLRIDVLKERYADSYQIGYLVSMRADVQVAHVEAFAELIGIEARA